MKALTIKQPWASLIVNGYKEYEFRSWKINYRGKILIHAGMRLEKAIAESYKEYNLNYTMGAIIGEAELVDCIQVDECFNKKLNKKVLVNGTIENIQNPVFKNIRVYIPQQVNLNVNLKFTSNLS